MTVICWGPPGADADLHGVVRVYDDRDVAGRYPFPGDCLRREADYYNRKMPEELSG